jgi:L-methionine (R)-S-oxide reductase
MAENLIIPVAAGKEEKYKQLLPQIEALVSGEDDLIANLSNIAAALKYGMGFFWIGFYLVRKNKEGKEELVLGPFQGPIACTRISFGKGVCGACWERAETIVVEDVDKFPGHIACSSESRSEIVVPVLNKDGSVAMVMDVDSDKLADFDNIDNLYLNKLVRLIAEMI